MNIAVDPRLGVYIFFSFISFLFLLDGTYIHASYNCQQLGVGGHLDITRFATCVSRPRIHVFWSVTVVALLGAVVPKDDGHEIRAWPAATRFIPGSGSCITPHPAR